MKTKQTKMVGAYFAPLGRIEKERIINDSPLSDREVNILSFRFVHGYSIKESSEKLNMDYDTFNKAQKRAIDKVYIYLTNKLQENSIH